MSEMPGHHELQSFGCARRIASDHGIARHDLTNGSRMGIQTFSGDLLKTKVKTLARKRERREWVLCMPNLWQ